MRQSYLLVCSALLLSCAPGSTLEPFKPSRSSKSSASAQPLGSDAIPVPADLDDTRTPPPDDPQEEEKAIEPAVIGGAYLYCDADENKPTSNTPPPMNVGCRVGNVPDEQWATAEKSMFVMNSLDDMLAPSTVSITPQGSPYHMTFNADRSLQNNLELHADVMLPQGRIVMSTTINPGAMKAIEQRLGKGLALYASTGSNGDWPGIDRKTWNLWMPVEIPKYISNFTPAAPNSGPGPGPGGPGPEGSRTQGKVELIFDETVCTYEIGDTGGKDDGKGTKPEDYVFASCTRNWKPQQWVRVKTLSLRFVDDERRSSKAAGVIMKTEP
jgi:hypothetical protein